jgi:hypothetical protein
LLRTSRHFVGDTVDEFKTPRRELFRLFRKLPPLCTKPQFVAITHTLGPQLTRRGKAVLRYRLNETGYNFLIQQSAKRLALPPSKIRSQCRKVEAAAEKLLIALGQPREGRLNYSDYQFWPQLTPLWSYLIAGMESSTRKWWRERQRAGHPPLGISSNGHFGPPRFLNEWSFEPDALRNADPIFLSIQSAERLSAAIHGVGLIRETAGPTARQQDEAVTQGKRGSLNAAKDVTSTLLNSLFRLHFELAHRYKANPIGIERKIETAFRGATFSFVKACLPVLEARVPDFQVPTDGAIYERYRKWLRETK